MVICGFHYKVHEETAPANYLALIQGSSDNEWLKQSTDRNRIYFEHGQNPLSTAQQTVGQQGAAAAHLDSSCS